MHHLIVLHEGEFGAAVADELAADEPLRRAALHAPDAELEALVASAGFVAVALWRRAPAAAARLDAICARHRVPWSQAVLDGPELIAGPVVVPGGPCHACFQKRWATHAGAIDRERALDACYDADPAAGPGGFLPGMVIAAAAGLRADRDDGAAAAGRVRIVDLLGGGVIETRVVRVHGCALCGSPAEGPERYVARLRPALAEVLS